jgi:hypothetical protein
MELTNNVPVARISPLDATVTLLYEPGTTFRQLDARSITWFPTIAVLASSCALMLWFYQIVDFPWFVDQIVMSIGSAEEREQAAEFMSKKMMMMSSLGSVLIGYPIILILSGIYLMVTSKFLSHGIPFSKGFALAAWSSIPSLLLFPLGAMQILLTSSGQLGFSELNPLSLNQLFFHYDNAHPLASLMDSLSLTSFWGIFLLTLGFEAWAKVKRSTAIFVVLIPHVLIYGFWYIYGMSKLV